MAKPQAQCPVCRMWINTNGYQVLTGYHLDEKSEQKCKGSDRAPRNHRGDWTTPPPRSR